MDILEWFRDRWQCEAAHYTYVSIDAGHVKGRALFPDPLKAGEHYIKLTLAEIFLKNDRAWFSEWHPAGYSLVTLRFGNTAQTISHVAGPSSIKEVDRRSDATILLNHTVVPLVPFNGGEIELEAGVVAVKGADDVRQLLQVLTGISSTLAIPQLSAAIAFAQPVVDGIQSLAGSDKNQTKVRLHNSFSQGPALRAHYLAAIGAEAGTIPPSELFIVNDRLCRGATIDTAQSLTGFDYALFRLDAFSERDDWEQLSSIKEPFDQAVDALSNAAMEPEPDKQAAMLAGATRWLTVALNAAYKSKDLTSTIGRRQVVDALKRKFAEARQAFGQGAAAARPDFGFAAAMANRISPDEAAALGPLDESELFAG